MKTARRRAREFAIQGIYEWQLNPDRAPTTIDKHLIENEYFEKCDAVLYRSILFGVIEQAPVLEAHAAPFYDRKLSDISPIEHAIVLMAAFELTEHQETPYQVIINEAIEITKTFGGTDAHKFVNGVVDKMAQIVRPTEFAIART
ncbi:MAG: transcription antitermination factor NusB, partial [Neisseriaceae bacterium]|nr:transcription antitermination factor NusB [Neisseriaceae bacterium]